MGKGLGRHSYMDMRRGSYLMRSELTADEMKFGATRTAKIWDHGNILDQGSEGACVGFAWTAWHNCKPLGHANQLGNDVGFKWYERAKEIDPWPGTDYDGTATSAGADVAVERGHANKYLWAGSVAEVDAWLLNRGPIVVGSYWFKSMDNVRDDGFIFVDRNSGVRGGHAYLLIGKGREGNYVFQNSWGRGYGDDGLVKMSPESFSNLVKYGDSEFCTALHVKV